MTWMYNVGASDCQYLSDPQQALVDIKAEASWIGWHVYYPEAAASLGLVSS